MLTMTKAQMKTIAKAQKATVAEWKKMLEGKQEQHIAALDNALDVRTPAAYNAMRDTLYGLFPVLRYTDYILELCEEEEQDIVTCLEDYAGPIIVEDVDNLYDEVCELNDIAHELYHHVNTYRADEREVLYREVEDRL